MLSCSPTQKSAWAWKGTRKIEDIIIKTQKPYHWVTFYVDIFNNVTSCIFNFITQLKMNVFSFVDNISYFTIGKFSKYPWNLNCKRLRFQPYNWQKVWFLKFKWSDPRLAFSNFFWMRYQLLWNRKHLILMLSKRSYWRAYASMMSSSRQRLDLVPAEWISGTPTA